MIKHIEETKSLLNEQWYGLIKATLIKGTKKKHVPDVTKTKALKKFYESLAALMAQNLSDIAVRSLKIFTDFMCDIGVSWWFYPIYMVR